MNVAKEDPDIRAVLMSGSRANKDCPVDQYQDFDIVCFVKDVQSYWDNDGNYMYLMLFADGNLVVDGF